MQTASASASIVHAKPLQENVSKQQTYCQEHTARQLYANCMQTARKLHAEHKVKLDFIIYAKLPTDRDVSKLGKPQCKQQPQNPSASKLGKPV